MTAALLSGGFTAPAPQSARAFRAILEAMARPGQPFEVAGAAPPAPLSPAAGAVLLTLTDRSTPLYLAPSRDTRTVRAWITFHTGAPFCAPQDAAFALGEWTELMPLNRFAVGDAQYPDRSATLIVDGAAGGCAVRLSGPGLASPTVAELPDPAALADNAAQFPLGLDFIFCDGARVTGLPRSTRIEVL